MRASAHCNRLHKILVIGPSWVGDTILAQPFLRRLREQHPDGQLDVLAPAWTLPLLQRMSEVSGGIASPFAHGELRLKARVALAREQRERRYDHAFVLPNSFKSALIPWLARIEVRTGYVGELRYPLLNDARRLDARALPMMAERYAALAQPAGELNRLDRCLEDARAPSTSLRLVPLPVPGRSAHHAFCRCIKAVRSVTQTSSSRWLNMRCSKVTIPASGREPESLRPTTSVSARSVSPMNTGLGIRTLS